MEYSSAYQLVTDIHQNYIDEDWFEKLYKNSIEWDKSELSHVFKYFVWQKSMVLRVNIEFCIIVIYSLIFLSLIIIFVKDLHTAEKEAQALLTIRNCYYDGHGIEHRMLATVDLNTDCAYYEEVDDYHTQ